MVMKKLLRYAFVVGVLTATTYFTSKRGAYGTDSQINFVTTP